MTRVNRFGSAPAITSGPSVDGPFIEHALATAINDFLVASGAGVFVEQTLVQTMATLMTTPIVDDTPLLIGSSSDAKLLWETADANSNKLILALPDGGVTDVPVLAIGDQSIINKDLTFFNGRVDPLVAVLTLNEAYWIGIGSFSTVAPCLISNADFKLVPRNTTSKCITVGGADSVPTLYGSGAYLRIGDAATTSHTLAAEDDLMVSGKLEVDGIACFDGNVGFYTTTPVAKQTGIAAQKINYTTGDLDTEAEVIAAINTTNTAINALRTALNNYGLTTVV